MALTTCPYCGESISDKATTCPHCSSPLQNEQSAVAEPTQPAPQPQQPVQYAPVPQKNNSQTLIIILLVALLVIALGALAFFLLSRNSDSDKSDSGSKIDTVVQVVKTETTDYAPKATQKVFSPYGTHTLTGRISNNVKMQITISSNGNVTGSYYYTKVGVAIPLDGYYDASTGYLSMNEYGDNGVYTGELTGYFSSNGYEGQLYNINSGKYFSFHLK